MNPFREHMGLILRLMIVKMPLKMRLVLLCAASLAGCTTNAAHPSGAGASTTIKGPRTSTAPLPTVTAGESLLVVQTIESAGRRASPADVLQTSGLAPAKCTAWDYPALAGAGFDEVHLIVPSDKASVLRKALLRLSGVESVAEAGLGEFGRVQGKAPRPERMTC
jgi:hypothetical protein